MRDLKNIETRAVIELFFLHGKAPKEIHAILTETLACFLLGRAKDLSTPLCVGDARSERKLRLAATLLTKKTHYLSPGNLFPPLLSALEFLEVTVPLAEDDGVHEEGRESNSLQFIGMHFLTVIGFV